MNEPIRTILPRRAPRSRPARAWRRRLTTLLCLMALGGVARAAQDGGPGPSAGGERFVRGRAQGGPPGEVSRTQRQARVEIDEATRSVFITTDEATHQQILQVITALDRPVPQALIKVLFLEVTHSDELDVGLDITHSRTADDGDSSILSSVFGMASQTRGGIATILENDLEMTLAAIGTVARLNVLSRPSILARNGQQATITIGQEVPFIRNSRVTDSGQTINTVEYEDIGIILTVTPYIGSDGLIEMDVAPEISTLTGEKVAISDTVNAPVFAKRSAETHVIVPSGKTVVIGGLMEDQETESVTKVPLLGDIPWVGALFRRTARTKNKTELLIFLTPTLVDTGASLAALSAEEQGRHEMIQEQITPAQLRRYLGQPTGEQTPSP